MVAIQKAARVGLFLVSDTGLTIAILSSVAGIFVHAALTGGL